uniref:Selenoprotein S n=1 Tax=Aquila chrysaetos chrysaetos TaxID=223781 RepID=A0A663EL49_AQUCH
RRAPAKGRWGGGASSSCSTRVRGRRGRGRPGLRGGEARAGVAGLRRARRTRLPAEERSRVPPGRPPAFSPPGWVGSFPPPAACSHLRLVPVPAGSLLSSYGWYILVAAVAIYLLIQKISQSLAARPSSQPGAADAAVEPDVVVRRQEALAAARLRMQEELNAQAERYKEKQRQLEEEKRRQKIAMWESMQEGKSYKGNLKVNQQEVESGASTSSAVPKSKPNKKPLRGGGYNPLSGEGGGTCSWRPGRRGPSAEHGPKPFLARLNSSPARVRTPLFPSPSCLFQV